MVCAEQWPMNAPQKRKATVWFRVVNAAAVREMAGATMTGQAKASARALHGRLMSIRASLSRHQSHHKSRAPESLILSAPYAAIKNAISLTHVKRAVPVTVSLMVLSAKLTRSPKLYSNGLFAGRFFVLVFLKYLAIKLIAQDLL